MDKYAMIVKLTVLLLLFSYADENVASAGFIQDRPKKKVQLNEGQKLLSAARNRMRNKKNAKPKEIKTRNADLIETKKLARMYQKLKYEEIEIKQFLNIQPENFKNNAELSQLYNETLFRIMEREPRKFIRNTLRVSDVRRKMMDRYMKSPVGDNLNIKKMNDQLQKEVKTQWKAYEPKLRSNDKEVLTKEYNRYESLHRIFRSNNQRLKEPRRLTQLRKAEAIRAAPDRRVAPVIERRSDTIPK